MDEAALHELFSGRQRGLAATSLRTALYAASWGYAAATSARNLAYDRGWLTIHRAPVPVISIGNITTGGTGKTPMSAWLANWFTSAGYRPGLLSRGYRSLKSSADQANPSTNDAGVEGNDEKRVLERLCPGVPHLQQRDRVASAAKAVSEFGCNVLLLDDGFQHRRLHRDLDLVLVDSLRPWGYEHLLPRGLLRESLSGLKRADVVVITRADQCSANERAMLHERLRQIRGNDDCVEIAFAPQRLVDLKWNSQSIDRFAGKKALAFCGIGNPAGFRQTLGSLGIASEQFQQFPDHHHYSTSDLRQLALRAQEMSAEVVFTTQKDLVKINALDWSGPQLFAVEIGVQFLSGEAVLESQLKQVMSASVKSPR